MAFLLTYLSTRGLIMIEFFYERAGDKMCYFAYAKVLKYFLHFIVGLWWRAITQKRSRDTKLCLFWELWRPNKNSNTIVPKIKKFWREFRQNNTYHPTHKNSIVMETLIILINIYVLLINMPIIFHFHTQINILY